MSEPGINVGVSVGRAALIVTDVDTLTELAALVDQANSQMINVGKLPLSWAPRLVAAARHVVSRAALALPVTEEQVASNPRPSPSLATVGQASQRLGIGERAVIERIHAGTLPATRFGKVWMIDEKELYR